MLHYPKINNNSTFQNNLRPPNFNVPPPSNYGAFSRPQISDQEFVKTFERKLNTAPNVKPKSVSISGVRQQLRNIVKMINNLKGKELKLEENINNMSEEEWITEMNAVKKDKVLLDGLMIQINDSYLDLIRHPLEKRSAKRLRLKKKRVEKQRLNKVIKREREEKSRKIDEHLQKVQDDINKAKQIEKTKIKADIVLREVSRQKQDAKKCISKLDALINLRKARQNTARGRGVNVSENESMEFNNSILQLKSLWVQKLSTYEKEESNLRATLLKDPVASDKTESESKAMKALAKWKKCLFGSSSAMPQVQFEDVRQFIARRFQWDQYINSEGTPLPVGWVVPV